MRCPCSYVVRLQGGEVSFVILRLLYLSLVTEEICGLRNPVVPEPDQELRRHVFPC